MIVGHDMIKIYLDNTGLANDQTIQDLQTLRIAMCIILAFVASEYKRLALCSFLSIEKIVRIIGFRSIF